MKLLATLFLSFFFYGLSAADDFPNTLTDADPKSFCLKEPDSFDIDQEHVMIIVDRTTNLAEEQI